METVGDDCHVAVVTAVASVAREEQASPTQGVLVKMQTILVVKCQPRNSCDLCKIQQLVSH